MADKSPCLGCHSGVGWGVLVGSAVKQTGEEQRRLRESNRSSSTTTLKDVGSRPGECQASAFFDSYEAGVALQFWLGRRARESRTRCGCPSKKRIPRVNPKNEKWGGVKDTTMSSSFFFFVLVDYGNLSFFFFIKNCRKQFFFYFF